MLTGVTARAGGTNGSHEPGEVPDRVAGVADSSVGDDRATDPYRPTGDLLLHHRVNEIAAHHAASDPDRAYDYGPLLEPIRPSIEEAQTAFGR